MPDNGGPYGASWVETQAADPPPTRPGSARLLAVAGLQNVWVCAQDLQLIRADRIISLLVPIATGYGTASPGDRTLHRAVWAEIEGGTGGETLTRVKLADCGKTPAAQLLASLAAALGSVAAAGLEGGCVFVFAEQDQGGFHPVGHCSRAARRLAAKHNLGQRSGGAHQVTACPARGGTAARWRPLVTRVGNPAGGPRPRPGRVRFWERNGSGDPLLTAVRRGQPT